MSYPYKMDKLIQTDAQKEWASSCANQALALILTARLALDNEGSGICSDIERTSVIADTLEVAYSLMSIAADGTEVMQREAGIGCWSQYAAKGGAA